VHFYVRNNKHTQKYKDFLNKAARSWISKVQNPNYSSFDELQWPEKQTTPRGPNMDTPGRLSGDFTKQDHVKYILQIRREMKRDTFVNSVFRFTKGLDLRNSSALGPARLSICSFFNT
jgi:hypothetical protein